MGVHAGLMVTYKSREEDKFVILSVDLAAVDVNHPSGEKVNTIVHTLQVQDGLEDYWRFKAGWHWITVGCILPSHS